MYRRRLYSFHELQRIQEWMNRILPSAGFSGRLLPAIGGDRVTVKPSVDIQDTADKIIITADVPGVEKKDMNNDVKYYEL